MTMTLTKLQAHDRVHNFSAGPSALPLPVLEQIQKDMLHLPGAGASVLEISHRSKDFDKILGEAESDLRTLLGISGSHKIFFLQGGASHQFAMLPMNLARGKRAGYLLTGEWGKKAYQEAQAVAEAEVLWSGASEKYCGLPPAGAYKTSPELAYVHYTSNETIQGVQFHHIPEAGGAPLVCDMSSDFLSRPIKTEQYGVIYAGAQKNVGPAGLTVVVMREDLVSRSAEDIAPIFKYATHEGSRYNTPPVFAIYAAGLTFKWLLNTYGNLKEVSAAGKDKAETLYGVIDASGGFYKPHAKKDCRSHMNVTWTLKDKKLEDAFLKEAEAHHLSGLKGHRSVGGMRASLYNAVPKESVSALAAFMTDFMKRNS